MSEQIMFDVVCLLSAYVFAKEHYNDSNSVLVPDDNHIQDLANMLAEIDCYVTVPDKARLIKHAFKKLADLSVDGQVAETKLFELIQSRLESVSDTEKKNILNAVIYIARKDRKISLKEKEFIQQVAHCLGLSSDYNTIIKEYSNSGIKRPIETWKILSIGISVIIVIGAVIFSLIQSNIQKVNVFDEQSVAFSKISFNRFVVYKNKFNDDSKHYKKQAIFYFNGTAEISLKPESLQYNPVTQVITYQYSKSLFQVTPNFSQSLKVDEIKPEPLSEDKAKNIAIGVGLATAWVGAKAGSSLSSYVPAPYSLVATVGGGVAGGAAGYYLTSELLKDASLTKDISQQEIETVINTGRTLIGTLLTVDPELILMYKKDFEKYITSRYKRFGLSVSSVQYEEVK